MWPDAKAPQEQKGSLGHCMQVDRHLESTLVVSTAVLNLVSCSIELKGTYFVIIFSSVLGDLLRIWANQGLHYVGA